MNGEKLVKWSIEQAYSIASLENEGCNIPPAMPTKLMFMNAVINIVDTNLKYEKQIEDLEHLIEAINLYE